MTPKEKSTKIIENAIEEQMGRITRCIQLGIVEGNSEQLAQEFADSFEIIFRKVEEETYKYARKDTLEEVYLTIQEYFAHIRQNHLLDNGHGSWRKDWKKIGRIQDSINERIKSLEKKVIK